MAITPLPSAPLPTDSTAAFNSKAFALVASFDVFVTEANAQAVDIASDAATASTGASTATTKATESSSSAAAALASQNAAASSQSAAATSASQANSFATAASGSATTALNKANEASASAFESEQSALEAAGSAASAAQIVYGNLIMHPNRIDQSISIPDGYNAFFIDPVEFGPNVTITGLGNSTLRGV